MSRLESRYHRTRPAESTMIAAPWVNGCEEMKIVKTVKPLESPGPLTVTDGRSAGSGPVTSLGPASTAESPPAPQILTQVSYVVLESRPSRSTAAGHDVTGVRGVLPESTLAAV